MACMCSCVWNYQSFLFLCGFRSRAISFFYIWNEKQKKLNATAINFANENSFASVDTNRELFCLLEQRNVKHSIKNRLSENSSTNKQHFVRCEVDFSSVFVISFVVYFSSRFWFSFFPYRSNKSQLLAAKRNTIALLQP